MAVVFFVLLALLLSCDIDRSDLTNPAVRVATIIVVPEIVTLDPLGTAQFHAFGRTTSGDSVPVAVHWSASAGGITDLALFVADSSEQDVIISATLAHPARVPITGRAVVRKRRIRDVILTPAAIRLRPGAVQQFSATVVTSHGDTTAAAVRYSATGGSVTADGLYTAGPVVGDYHVIGAYPGGLADTASVRITPLLVARVSVSPGSATLAPGATIQLSATTKDSAGNALEGGVTAWSSDAPQIASVSGSGLVTAHAAGGGTAIIFAAREGQSGTAAITVTASPPPPVCRASTTTWANTPFNAETRSFTATFGVTPGAAGIDALTALSAAPASRNTDMALTVRFNTSGRIDARNGSRYTAASAIPYTPGTRYHFRLVVDVVAHRYSAYVTPAGGTELTIGTGLAFRTEQSSVTSLANLAVQANVGTHQVCDFAMAGSTSPASVAGVTVTPDSTDVKVGGTLQLAATPRDAAGIPLSGRAVTWTSSNTGIATVSASGFVTGVAPGAVTITATSEGHSGMAAITVTAPPPPPLPPGCQVSSTTWVNTSFTAETRSFTATFDVTPNAASMDGLTALSAAPASRNTDMALTVRFNTSGRIDARNGSGYTAASPIPYTPGTRYHFRLVVDVATHRYSAYVTAAGGTELTIGTGLAFRTEQSTVTSLANLAVQANSGTHQVCAFVITDNTPPPAPVASVTVTPASADVVVGTSIQLTATARDAAGNSLSGREVTWTSSDTGVATVSASGLVTGVAAGSGTITATSEGRSGSTVTTVRPVPVASVSVSPASATLAIGASIQLAATARDSAGNVLDGRAIIWSSDAAAIGSVSDSGLVTAHDVGTTIITATSEGQSGTTTITVTAPPPPPPSADCQVSSTTWVNRAFAAEFSSFTATFGATPNTVGMDGLTALSAGAASRNTDMALTVRFNTSGRIDARNGGGYSAASVIPYTPGKRYHFRLVVDVVSHRYSAYVTPAGGTELTIGTGLAFRNEQSSVTSLTNLAVQANVGSHQVCDFVITESTSVASVTVTPASAMVSVGTSMQLTATPRDAAGNPLTERSIIWASSDTSVAVVNTAGRVTGVAPGSAAITATSEGKSGTAAIMVPPPPPPPPPPSLGGLPVVPGIEGHGSTTPAGRGGIVLRVTNLDDAGPGSLRAALEASGPRVVIFEISGTILVTRDIVINNPYLTVAGQTAPSPGILVRGAAIRVNTHDVLLQHLRIRAGDDPVGPSPSGRDALGVYGKDVYNVVIDHVSASWGIDENAGTSTAGTRHDITIINSIISEGLSQSLHEEGEHSKGLLVGQGSRNISIVRCVLAHNRDRNPYFKGNTFTLFVNNVVYNYGRSYAIENGDGGSHGPQQSSQVGNVFIAGVNTPSGRPIRVHRSVKPGSLIYVTDNSFNRAPVPPDPWSIVDDQVGASIRASTPPIWTSLTILPNAAVEAWVLTNAGARPADRDAVDLRIVNEIRTNAGRIIDSPGQVGGWPVLAVNTRALTLPAAPNADDDGDGYTNLEEWLHQFAAQAEGR
jgi:uncharacterized protein YjdB